MVIDKKISLIWFLLNGKKKPNNVEILIQTLSEMDYPLKRSIIQLLICHIFELRRFKFYNFVIISHKYV